MSHSRAPAARRVTVLAAGAGGAIGTGLRFTVGELLPSGAAATLTVNLIGALLLGVLLGWVDSSAGRPIPGSPPPSGPCSAPTGPGRVAGRPRWGPEAVAFFGTGVLGGFTTYSALALEIVELPGWHGVGYGLLTLTGVAVALAGIVLGRRVRT